MKYFDELDPSSVRRLKPRGKEEGKEKRQQEKKDFEIGQEVIVRLENGQIDPGWEIKSIAERFYSPVGLPTGEYASLAKTVDGQEHRMEVFLKDLRGLNPKP